MAEKSLKERAEILGEELTEACFRARDIVKKFRYMFGQSDGAPKDSALGCVQYLFIALRCMGVSLDDLMMYVGHAASRAYEGAEPAVDEVYPKGGNDKGFVN